MRNFKPLQLFLFCFICYETSAQQSINTFEIAQRVLNKGLKETDLGTYQGSLLLQAMTDLAMVYPEKNVLNEVISIYKKFGTGEVQGKGSFISYKAGGSGAAFLNYSKATDALSVQVSEAAKEMYTTQKRSKERVLTANWASQKTDQVFIDMAFAVTPYMLYAGLSLQKSEYVDLAVFETLELFRILRDSKTQLLHQGRGFKGSGVVSEDNWSRGNGWGALALAILIRDLPSSHSKRKEVETLADEFFRALLRYQDKAGLWHQEITDSKSFTETSGSGLLLYSLGIMLERGLLDKKYQDNFLRGITSLTSYIAWDGSVSHACYSCLCPRNGTKDDYINHVWIYNDPHGFGPIVLALAQAAKIGYVQINALEPGKYAALDTITPMVRTYVKYVPERSQDIAWENDRIAFRYYGPPVRDKVSSGIDIWTKSVDYSIIDKWYRLNARGEDYHLDRGEGCDFYHMGFFRGCGGTAVWRNGKPFPSPTYDAHRIIKNDKDRLEFTLKFDTWNAAGLQVSEEKKISMINGTNFFQVVSTIRSKNKEDIIIGIGLTTFGKPLLIKEKDKGLLSSFEKTDSTKGSIGTAVMIDPKQFMGFAESEGDQYILIKVKPGKPFTYYAGAGWGGNKHFAAPEAWNNYVTDGTSWLQLEKAYKK
ncbi:MAG: DUF4861 family protein [Chitinophagaceae bacterium]|nr:DUF4861 family protein [Chitinophagaceae bacterium]